jgi:hypothetical protein
VGGEGGAEAVEHGSFAVAGGHVDVAGFIDRQSRGFAGDDRLRELAARGAGGVELIDHALGVFEGLGEPVGDVEVAVGGGNGEAGIDE